MWSEMLEQTMAENPFDQLGLKKDTIEYLHRQGRLEGFLRDYYRISQRHLHPDLGGDTGLSATVNAAHEEITRHPDRVSGWIRSMQNGAQVKDVPFKYGPWDEGEVRRERTETRRRKTKTPVEPIILPNLVLYDAKGKPFRRYKTVTVGGEAERDKGDNYLAKTQDQWIEYYRGTRGTPNRLPSLPLLYAIIEKLHAKKHPAAAGLLTDFRESRLATSTRLDYGHDKIIHDYGLAPLELRCAIPEGDHQLSDIKKKKPWKTILQALLMPKDVEQAIEVLDSYLGLSSYIWTANEGTRRSHSLRAAFFYVRTGGPILDCNNYLHDYGRSRRVAVVE